MDAESNGTNDSNPSLSFPATLPPAPPAATKRQDQRRVLENPPSSGPAALRQEAAARAQDIIDLAKASRKACLDTCRLLAEFEDGRWGDHLIRKDGSTVGVKRTQAFFAKATGLHESELSRWACHGRQLRRLETDHEALSICRKMTNGAARPLALLESKHPDSVAAVCRRAKVLADEVANKRQHECETRTGNRYPPRPIVTAHITRKAVREVIGPAEPSKKGSPKAAPPRIDNCQFPTDSRIDNLSISADPIPSKLAAVLEAFSMLDQLMTSLGESCSAVEVAKLHDHVTAGWCMARDLQRDEVLL